VLEKARVLVLVLVQGSELPLLVTETVMELEKAQVLVLVLEKAQVLELVKVKVQELVLVKE
jgi:hypothetical protein